ncbi:MAG: hypothetical protein AB7S68_40965 [Polyangiaceae bacterium]
MPIYAHFSLPLIALLAGGFEFRPYLWLGTLLVVLIHELGHVVLLRRYRLPVLALNLHGVGGDVHTNEWITPWQRCVVAWGGVLAQLSIFVVLGGLARLKLVSHEVKAHDLYEALVGANLLIALVNLLPLPPLDGAEAWKLPRFLYLRGKGAYYEGRLQELDQAKKRAEAEDDDAPPPRDQLH